MEAKHGPTDVESAHYPRGIMQADDLKQPASSTVKRFFVQVR
jgi:hypothetical protein